MPESWAGAKSLGSRVRGNDAGESGCRGVAAQGAGNTEPTPVIPAHAGTQ
ncbi:hypothetical protein PCLA_09f0013 [Pseudomonas citronellolis]|nr:hypothetical protein PCLA_09f0013 [Pseudomonas citronellolis]